MTGFGKIGLNAASKVSIFFPTSKLHWALGCRPPNLEVVAQAVFALQHFSIFAKLIIADFGKTKQKKNNNKTNKQKKTRKGVAKARGRVLHPYTITACLRDTMD